MADSLVGAVVAYSAELDFDLGVGSLALGALDANAITTELAREVNREVSVNTNISIF